MKTKYEQKESFKDNLVLTATAVLECVICGDSIVEEVEDENEAGFEALKTKLVEKAYEEGWRESTSNVYGHIGIHCPDCHKNRNNSKYFD